MPAAELPFAQLFELAVVEDSSTSSKGLELAYYKADSTIDSDHKLSTGYLDSNGGFHDHAMADGENNVLAKKFNVTITMKTASTVTDSAGNVWTLNDALEAIYAQNFKIYVDAKTGERARVFNSTAAETAQGEEPSVTYDNIVQINSGNKALNTLITKTSGTPDTYSKKADASITYSFWVYVYGGTRGSSGEPADTTAITGNLRVTVANASDSAPGAYTGA